MKKVSWLEIKGFRETKINGEEFLYKTVVIGLNRESYTKFYKGVKSIKKYYFFGKKIDIPKCVFRINFDLQYAIESDLTIFVEKMLNYAHEEYINRKDDKMINIIFYQHSHKNKIKKK